MAVRKHVVARFGFHPTFCYYETYTRTAKYDLRKRRFRSEEGAEALQWRPGIAATRLQEGTLLKNFEHVEITDIRPDTAVPDHRKRVKKKRGVKPGNWVYIFAAKAGASTAEWFAELWTADKATSQLNPRTSLEERLQWTPKKPKPKADQATGERPSMDADVGADGDAVQAVPPNVPYSVGGNDNFVTAIAVPHRLSNKCLKKLEQTIVPLADFVSVRAGLRRFGGDDENGTSHAWLEIPVLYPFEVARELALAIRRARSLYSRQNGMPGENVDDPSGEPLQPDQAATESCKQHALASALSAMMKGSGKLNKAIMGSLDKSEGIDALKRCLKARPYHQLRYHVEAELLGTDLAGWLSRDLVRAVMDGYLVSSKAAGSNEIGPLMEALGLACAALKHTSTGLAFLSALGGNDWRGTLLGAVAAPTAPKAMARIEHARPYTSALLAIGGVAIAARVVSQEIEGYHVANEINQLYGAAFDGDWQDSVVVQKEMIDRHVLAETLFSEPGRAIDPVTVRARRLELSKRATGRLEKISGGLDGALKILDAINLVIVVHELHEISGANRGLRRKKLLEVTLSSLELVQTALEFAFPAKDQIKHMAPRVLGTVIAVWTAAESGIKAHKALTRGDMDAFAAMAVTSVSAVLAIGVTAFGQATAAAGVFGAVLAAIGVLGSLIYVWVKDTEFETFVAHCFFGRRRYNSVSTQEPAWALVPLNKLASSWDTQLEALASIQGQFSLYTDHTMHHDSADLNNVRLRPGMLGVGSVFTATWTWQDPNAPSHAPKKTFTRRIEGTEGLRRDKDGLYLDLIVPRPAYRPGVGAPLPVGLELSVTREVSAGPGMKVSLPLRGPAVIQCLRAGRSQAEKIRSMDKEDEG